MMQIFPLPRIAMESTGNYWQTLFAALEKAGFEVFLVCDNQTKLSIKSKS
jgi:transposase